MTADEVRQDMAVADGIRPVTETQEKQDTPAFNVEGQRVGDSYQGVVISNGTKTIRTRR